jgi:hypothetical protein
MSNNEQQPASKSANMQNAMLKVVDGMVVGDVEREQAVMAAIAVFCCPYCEYPALAGWRFCPSCGVALVEMKPIKK